MNEARFKDVPIKRDDLFEKMVIDKLPPEEQIEYYLKKYPSLKAYPRKDTIKFLKDENFLKPQVQTKRITNHAQLQQQFHGGHSGGMFSGGLSPFKRSDYF